MALLVVLGSEQGHAVGAVEPTPPELEEGIQGFKWTVDLPSKTCPGSSSERNCHWSSPAAADIDGNGTVDVVAGTNNGHVVAVSHDGSILWDTDVSPAFGMASSTQEIASSPAIADIDADGRPEVVVGTGSIRADVCTEGGVVVLDHTGNVQHGWPQLAVDGSTGAPGCRDTVFSSPAVGDLDNDGDMEIVAGGFDKRIYAWHHDGSLLPGYPPDSYHSQTYPTWDSLKGRLADTIWSSPALADIDRDGYLDVVIGSDEGDLAPDRDCPYEVPPGWPPEYCGGGLYVLDRHGELLPGFPVYIDETMQSSPAVADINDDGSPDIVVGTGSFYHNSSPDHPTAGFRLFAFDARGNPLPGWEGGQPVGGPVPASPAVGDITGDGQSEIVVAVKDEKKLYAWTGTGELVPGFPMTPLDLFGNTTGNYDAGTGFVLADYNGDGDMEIFFAQGWVITIVDGNGAQLTSPRFPGATKPIYYTDGTLLNTPVVADVDGDDRLELLAQNAKLYAWDLPAAGNDASWQRFKRSASGVGYVPMPPRLASANAALSTFYDVDGGRPARVTLTIVNVGDGVMEWQATTPERVALTVTSGTVTLEQRVDVIVDASGLEPGRYELGHIQITATSDGEPVAGSPISVPVAVVVGEVSHVFLPTVRD